MTIPQPRFKPMSNPVQSFYHWYKTTIRHPKYRWLLIGGSLLYLLSPLDISPDFIPIVGWIDDGVIATLLVAEVGQLMLSLLNRSKPAPTSMMEDPAPTVDVESR